MFHPYKATDSHYTLAENGIQPGDIVYLELIKRSDQISNAAIYNIRLKDGTELWSMLIDDYEIRELTTLEAMREIKYGS